GRFTTVRRVSRCSRSGTERGLSEDDFNVREPADGRRGKAYFVPPDGGRNRSSQRLFCSFSGPTGIGADGLTPCFGCTGRGLNFSAGKGSRGIRWASGADVATNTNKAAAAIRKITDVPRA